MRLLDRLREGQRGISTLDDFAMALGQWGYAGAGPVQQTLNGKEVEAPQPSFVGFGIAAKSNSVVFSCMLARMQVFSAARFQWQRLGVNGPSAMFGTPALSLFEEPWPGATTQDLLSRMIQDADLAGNSFWYADTSGLTAQLVRMRPDWVNIVRAKRPAGGWEMLGYYYQDPERDGYTWFDANQVAHFAPLPDPFNEYRGMSWLTPIVRETQTDNQMNVHKQAFFVNGATPNMVVKYDATVKSDAVERFIEMAKREHGGAWNAYKTMHLGGGADVTVVGKDFKQIDLKAVQGHGETRIAAAAGVPPIIVGLSEGLEAATYSNYGQARRRFADGTVHPLWQNVAGSLGQIMAPPTPGVRLWYDTRDVPFLREDELDAATIQTQQAATINTLITAGYEPKSVVGAVMAGDFSLLVHSGLVSVQLSQPGDTQPAPGKELVK